MFDYLEYAQNGRVMNDLKEKVAMTILSIVDVSHILSPLALCWNREQSFVDSFIFICLIGIEEFMMTCSL